MNNIKRVLLVLLYLLFAPHISAQKIDFKNISTKDGLPQSDVYDAVQDNVGYIWLATQGGGIAKYDGIDFTIYNQNNGLLSNFTNALLLKKTAYLSQQIKGYLFFIKGVLQISMFQKQITSIN